jgi:hypothetical protein
VRVDVKNVSNGLRWRLSGLDALEPKKWLKRPDGGLGSGGKGAENSPKGRRFLPPFTGTETYGGNFDFRK